MALRAEKIPVPNAEQRYDHGQIISQRRVQEMLVHLLRAGAQRAEMRGADLQHDRQPRRGPQRITPANPIPHLKQVFKRNAELNRRLSIGSDADEMHIKRRFRRAALEKCVAQRARVAHRLKRGEGFGDDNRERCVKIDGFERALYLRAVDIRHKMDIQIGSTERMQRLTDHFWTELRAADANIDERADRLAGIAAPMAAAHALGKRAHFLKRLMNQCRMRRICIAARFSVGLTISPANIASRFCSTPASRANWSSSAKLWSVMRYFEKSSVRPPPVRVNRCARVGACASSAANQSRICASRIVSKCAASARQAGRAVKGIVHITTGPSAFFCGLYCVASRAPSLILH